MYAKIDGLSHLGCLIKGLTSVGQDLQDLKPDSQECFKLFSGP